MQPVDGLTQSDSGTAVAQPPFAGPFCSAKRGSSYGAGYAAGRKHAAGLKAEIDALRAMKMPDKHEATIEYLLEVAETFTATAEVLIRMRSNEPPAVDGFEKHDPHGTKLAELLDAAIQPPPNK